MRPSDFVYAAFCDGYLKIGFSKDPKNRIRSMNSRNTKFPVTIQGKKPILVATAKGTCADERLIHHRLGKFKVTGEWFLAECAREGPYLDFFHKTDPHGRGIRSRSGDSGDSPLYAEIKRMMKENSGPLRRKILGYFQAKEAL